MSEHDTIPAPDPESICVACSRSHLECACATERAVTIDEREYRALSFALANDVRIDRIMPRQRAALRRLALRRLISLEGGYATVTDAGIGAICAFRLQEGVVNVGDER